MTATRSGLLRLAAFIASGQKHGWDWWVWHLQEGIWEDYKKTPQDWDVKL